MAAVAVLIYPLLLAVWMIALGATAVYDDMSISLRVDLHFRALGTCWKSVLGIFVRLFVFALLAAAVSVAFAPDPSSPSNLVVTALPAIVIQVYVALDVAHMIGLTFRRHGRALAAIYHRG